MTTWRELYRRMRNVAAGYSNICEESGTSRKYDREFEDVDSEARFKVRADEDSSLALDFLCGLHTEITVDGPPMQIAQLIFDHVTSERRNFQERITQLEKTIHFLNRT